MAGVRLRTKPVDHASAVDAESDYGSDFDDEVLTDLLAASDLQPLNQVVLTSIEQDPVTEYAVVHLRSSGRFVHEINTAQTPQPLSDTLPTTIEYSIEQDPSKPQDDHSRREESVLVDDNRSPLERFRTHPKKPLSVTDLVSPAWCEQQYLYSLTKHGRVKRTPAMKQGSAVHKVLEEQVHTTVKIDVKSREDMFGLKIWNVIQGLRTLRATALTRELEVWGLLEGQVINGIIDVVTTHCPDRAFEDKMLQRPATTNKQPKLEANQTTLQGFFAKSQDSQGAVAQSEPSTTVYILDVKTRQSPKVPSIDGSFRPTQMQLMLYHRLLNELAAGMVDYRAVLQRYNLESDKVFSDVFIAEMSRLDFDELDGQQDSVTELLEHNTLAALWQLMLTEFGKTLSSATSPLSNMLTAEFRFAGEGSLLGKRSFAFDASKLNAYVQDELSWWRGERSTRGVDIEEAFKCRMCGFADECSWRKNKVEESLQQARQKKAAQTAAAG